MLKNAEFKAMKIAFYGLSYRDLRSETNEPIFTTIQCSNHFWSVHHG